MNFSSCAVIRCLSIQNNFILQKPGKFRLFSNSNIAFTESKYPHRDAVSSACLTTKIKSIVSRFSADSGLDPFPKAANHLREFSNVGGYGVGLSKSWSFTLYPPSFSAFSYPSVVIRTISTTPHGKMKTLGKQIKQKELAIGISGRHYLYSRAEKLQKALKEGVIKQGSQSKVLNPGVDTLDDCIACVEKNSCSTFLKYQETLGDQRAQNLYEIGNDFVINGKIIRRYSALEKFRKDRDFKEIFNHRSYEWGQEMGELDKLPSKLSDEAINELTISKHNISVLIHIFIIDFYTRRK